MYGEDVRRATRCNRHALRSRSTLPGCKPQRSDVWCIARSLPEVGPQKSTKGSHKKAQKVERTRLKPGHSFVPFCVYLLCLFVASLSASTDDRAKVTKLGIELFRG